MSKFLFMIQKVYFLLFFLSQWCLSQQTQPIEADRPDQTETPSIVPKRMFQVEAGFSYQKIDSNNQSINLPSALWKYGVNENFELRLITEFTIDQNNLEKQNGFTPILIGFKIKLCEEKGIIPKTSFISHTSLPNAASPKYKTNFAAPEFRFTMQHTLTENCNLGYNLGFEWDGHSSTPTYIYTFTTGFSLTHKFGSYIEIFGFAPSNESSSHNFDGGMTYLITDNFMVDLSSGIGLTDTAPKYYVALGFSFRN